MGLFNKFTTEGLEETQDRLGGYSLFETDAYPATITMAYAAPAASGAMGVAMSFDINGKEYRETFYVSTAEGKNYFMSKDKNGKETGNKSPLPGFTVVDDICLVTVEKPLAEIQEEEKVVNVYDYDAKKELPKSVPVLTELLNKPVILAIQKNLEDKTKKNDSTGKYEPTGDTKETNTVVKVFHHELKLTVPEARAGSPAAFHDAWVERNKGNIFNKVKGAGAAGSAGRPGAPTGNTGSAGSPTAAAGGTARTSLFGNKG